MKIDKKSKFCRINPKLLLKIIRIFWVTCFIYFNVTFINAILDYMASFFISDIKRIENIYQIIVPIYTLYFMTPYRLTFFLVDTSQIWVWGMNIYNKHNNLPYSDLWRIHKDTGNRPLKLGQFFSLGEF